MLLIVASFVVWGNTPKGDASGAEVFAHYADNRTEGLIAAGRLAVSTISFWHLPPCCVSAQDLVWLWLGAVGIIVAIAIGGGN